VLPALLAAVLLAKSVLQFVLRAVLHALLPAAAAVQRLPLSVSHAPKEGSMISGKGKVSLLAAVVVLLTAAGGAQAARVRYHYTILDDRGTTIVQPVTQGSPGERLTWRMRWEPYNCPPPRATCMVTFRHPCTGKTIILPLGLPADTPRMEYRNNRVIYNYGSDTVEVHFLTDGSADVIYNSGLLRAP